MFEFSGARATGDFSIGLGAPTVRLQDLPSCPSPPPITFEPLSRPCLPRTLFFSYWHTPCTLPAGLSLLLTTCKAHFPNSPRATAASTCTHAQTNRARFVSFRCRRCETHTYAFHPLLSLTSRRGRQRSTLPDSLSLILHCRGSHVPAQSSPSDEQTNRQTTISVNSPPPR